MRWLRLSLCLLALPLLAAEASFSPGIAVGEAAPAFELAGADGEDHSLSSLLREQRYVALLFFRSASW